MLTSTIKIPKIVNLKLTIKKNFWLQKNRNRIPLKINEILIIRA